MTKEETVDVSLPVKDIALLEWIAKKEKKTPSQLVTEILLYWTKENPDAFTEALNDLAAKAKKAGSTIDEYLDKRIDAACQALNLQP